MKGFIGLIIFLIVGSIGVGVLESRKRAIELELAHQKLIRIVEPAAYPLQRLGANEFPDWEEFFESCMGAGGGRTEQGIAWVKCEGNMGPVAFEGPNKATDVFGNATFKVRVLGFLDPQEKTCQASKVVDALQSCAEDSEHIFYPVVIGRFTITTKVERYTKEDIDSKELANRIFEAQHGPILNVAGKLPPTKVGDVKSSKITVSPIEYEFLDKK